MEADIGNHAPNNKPPECVFTLNDTKESPCEQEQIDRQERHTAHKARLFGKGGEGEVRPIVRNEAPTRLQALPEAGASRACERLPREVRIIDVGAAGAGREKCAGAQETDVE